MLAALLEIDDIVERLPLPIVFYLINLEVDFAGSAD